MKFVAILLLSSLTIAMVLAFPDNDDKNVLVPVDMQHVAPLAAAADPRRRQTKSLTAYAVHAIS